MTNEQLNTMLYQKMFAEQEAYCKWLVAQPPKEILGHAYEYTVREDVLISLEENNLSSKQAQVLLKSKSPLSDVFKEIESRETHYMEDIWAAVEGRANDVIREAALKEKKAPER